MTRLNVNGARCAALFASGLQRSDAPSPAAVAEVISQTVRRLGIAGCASQMAQEFGDHPEAAASRMRWIRQLISQTPAAAAVQPVQTLRAALLARDRRARDAGFRPRAAPSTAGIRAAGQLTATTTSLNR